MLYTVSTQSLINQLNIKPYVSDSFNLSQKEIEILLSNPESIQDLPNNESIEEFIQHILSFPKRSPVNLSFDNSISITHNENVLLAALFNKHDSVLVNIPDNFPNNLLADLNAVVEEDQSKSVDFFPSFDWHVPELSIAPIPLNDEESIVNRLAKNRNDDEFFKSIDKKLFQDSDFLLKALKLNSFTLNYLLKYDVVPDLYLLDTLKEDIDLLATLWRKKFKEEYTYSLQDPLILLAEDQDLNSLREEVWQNSYNFDSEKDINIYEKHINNLFKRVTKERSEFYHENVEKAKTIKHFFDNEVFYNPDKTLLFLNNIINDQISTFDINTYLEILPKSTLENQKIFNLFLSRLPVHNEQVTEFLCNAKPELFKNIDVKLKTRVLIQAISFSKRNNPLLKKMKNLNFIDSSEETGLILKEIKNLENANKYEIRGMVELSSFFNFFDSKHLTEENLDLFFNITPSFIKFVAEHLKTDNVKKSYLLAGGEINVLDRQFVYSLTEPHIIETVLKHNNKLIFKEDCPIEWKTNLNYLLAAHTDKSLNSDILKDLKLTTEQIDILLPNHNAALELIRKNENTYKHIPEKYKENTECAMQFLISKRREINESTLKLIPTILFNNEDFVFDCIKRNSQLTSKFIPFVNPLFWNNRNFLRKILHFIDNSSDPYNNFRILPDKIKLFFENNDVQNNYLQFFDNFIQASDMQKKFSSSKAVKRNKI